MIKRKVILKIVTFVFLLVFVYIAVNFLLVTTQNYNPKSHDETKAAVIKAAILNYIDESNDVRLEQMNDINNGKFNIISGKTKWNELVPVLQKEIAEKDDSNKSYGPLLQLGSDYMPKVYAGYRIEIFSAEKKVIVSPSKKESECVVIINNK